MNNKLRYEINFLHPYRSIVENNLNSLNLNENQFTGNSAADTKPLFDALLEKGVDIFKYTIVVGNSGKNLYSNILSKIITHPGDDIQTGDVIDYYFIPNPDINFSDGNIDDFYFLDIRDIVLVVRTIYRPSTTTRIEPITNANSYVLYKIENVGSNETNPETGESETTFSIKGENLYKRNWEKLIKDYTHKTLPKTTPYFGRVVGADIKESLNFVAVSEIDIDALLPTLRDLKRLHGAPDINVYKRKYKIPQLTFKITLFDENENAVYCGIIDDIIHTLPNNIRNELNTKRTKLKVRSLMALFDIDTLREYITNFGDNVQVSNIKRPSTIEAIIRSFKEEHLYDDNADILETNIDIDNPDNHLFFANSLFYNDYENKVLDMVKNCIYRNIITINLDYARTKITLNVHPDVKNNKLTVGSNFITNEPSYGEEYKIIVLEYKPTNSLYYAYDTTIGSYELSENTIFTNTEGNEESVKRKPVVERYFVGGVYYNPLYNKDPKRVEFHNGVSKELIKKSELDKTITTPTFQVVNAPTGTPLRKDLVSFIVSPNKNTLEIDDANSLHNVPYSLKTFGFLEDTTGKDRSRNFQTQATPYISTIYVFDKDGGLENIVPLSGSEYVNFEESELKQIEFAFGSQGAKIRYNYNDYFLETNPTIKPTQVGLGTAELNPDENDRTLTLRISVNTGSVPTRVRSRNFVLKKNKETTNIEFYDGNLYYFSPPSSGGGSRLYQWSSTDLGISFGLTGKQMLDLYKLGENKGLSTINPWTVTGRSSTPAFWIEVTNQPGIEMLIGKASNNTYPTYFGIRLKNIWTQNPHFKHNVKTTNSLYLEGKELISYKGTSWKRVELVFTRHNFQTGRDSDVSMNAIWYPRTYNGSYIDPITRIQDNTKPININEMVFRWNYTEDSDKNPIYNNRLENLAKKKYTANPNVIDNDSQKPKINKIEYFTLKPKKAIVYSDNGTKEKEITLTNEVLNDFEIFENKTLYKKSGTEWIEYFHDTYFIRNLYVNISYLENPQKLNLNKYPLNKTNKNWLEELPNQIIFDFFVNGSYYQGQKIYEVATSAENKKQIEQELDFENKEEEKAFVDMFKTLREWVIFTIKLAEFKNYADGKKIFKDAKLKEASKPAETYDYKHFPPSYIEYMIIGAVVNKKLTPPSLIRVGEIYQKYGVKEKFKSILRFIPGYSRQFQVDSRYYATFDNNCFNKYSNSDPAAINNFKCVRGEWNWVLGTKILMEVMKQINVSDLDKLIENLVNFKKAEPIPSGGSKNQKLTTLLANSAFFTQYFLSGFTGVITLIISFIPLTLAGGDERAQQFMETYMNLIDQYEANYITGTRGFDDFVIDPDYVSKTVLNSNRQAGSEPYRRRFLQGANIDNRKIFGEFATIQFIYFLLLNDLLKYLNEEAEIPKKKEYTFEKFSFSVIATKLNDKSFWYEWLDTSSVERGDTKFPANELEIDNKTFNKGHTLLSQPRHLLPERVIERNRVIAYTKHKLIEKDISSGGETKKKVFLEQVNIENNTFSPNQVQPIGTIESIIEKFLREEPINVQSQKKQYEEAVIVQMKESEFANFTFGAHYDVFETRGDTYNDYGVSIFTGYKWKLGQPTIEMTFGGYIGALSDKLQSQDVLHPESPVEIEYQ